mmetsp:Transcript_26609/g.63055  ORF Transcript_26609/g.63055 Transcript_26609/m.63055 type:complete len:198 (-) Transcript_26609:479-1072(-)
MSANALARLASLYRSGKGRGSSFPSAGGFCSGSVRYSSDLQNNQRGRRSLEFNLSSATMNDSRDQDPNPKTLIAVGQMTSGSDKEANFAVCSKLAKEARDAGCLALFLPECFSFLGSSWTESIAAAEPLDGPTMSRYRQLARSPPPKTSLVSLPSCQAAPLSRAHARAQQVRLPKIVKPSPAHTPFARGRKGLGSRS